MASSEQLAAFTPHRRSILADRDLAVFRWWTRELGVTPDRQDREIESLVNEWLNRHLDRRVKKITVDYSFAAQEGNKEQISPRFYVTVLSEKINPGERRFNAGERGFKVVRTQLRGDIDSFVEDRLVENQVNSFLDKNPDKRPRLITYQQDFAAIFEGGRMGNRDIVGLYWERSASQPGDQRKPGRFYVRRWSGGVTETPSNENVQGERMAREWQEIHRNERIVCHGFNYKWMPIGPQKGLTCRMIIALYAEEEPALRKAPPPQAEPQRGFSIVRYHAPTLMPGNLEDQEATQALNRWLDENPDKAVVDIHMHYDWGVIHGKGINASRFVYTITWERKDISQSPWAECTGLKAEVQRRLGRQAAASDWTPDEEDLALQNFAEHFERRRPGRRLISFGLHHQFANFYPNGRYATRHICMFLTCDRYPPKKQAALEDMSAAEQSAGLRVQELVRMAGQTDFWARFGFDSPSDHASLKQRYEGALGELRLGVERGQLAPEAGEAARLRLVQAFYVLRDEVSE